MGKMESRECPFCKEDIIVGAVKCRHCHSLLEQEFLLGANVETKPPDPGVKIKNQGSRRWLLWVPVMLVVILLIIALSGASLTGGGLEITEGEEETIDENDEAEGSFPGSKSDPKTAPGPQPDTLDSIVKKYEPEFAALEDQVEAELRALFNAAVREYEQGSGGLLFQLQLVNKYMKEIQKIEDKADAAFYSTLDQMHDELKNHGLPTDVIAEIEAGYERDKQAKKRELTNFLSDWSNW